MFVRLSLFVIFPLVSCQCTNMLFIEHSTHIKQTGKTTSIAISPGIIWKDHIIHYKQANEIYTKLDFNKYELMTHAYKEGVFVHRICEKNSEYSKYGTIIQSGLRGYIVNVIDLFETDLFLSNNGFTTYAHGHSKYNFNKYTQDKYKKTQQQNMEKIVNYRKTDPIKHFIYYNIITYIFIAFILYLPIYIISL